MNLMEIAEDALYADGAENDLGVGKRGNDANIERKDNGDGTVTLSFAFSLDPKIVAEKSRAMSKGLQRDDQSDDLDDSTGGALSDGKEGDDDVADEGEDEQSDGDEVEDDEDPYNGISTEDESTSCVFADAVDSLDVESEAMDARQNSRHAQSPLENCRAKDPLFCPYHGVSAWERKISDDLAAKNMNGGKVDVTNNNGRYAITVTVPSGLYREAMEVLSDAAKINGVMATTLKPFAAVAPTVGMEFSVNQWGDRVGRINEWIDDYLADYAGDPSAEIDLDDVSALLEAQDELEKFNNARDPNDPNDKKQFAVMLKDVENKYHDLVAQQYFSDVKSLGDASAKASELVKDADAIYSSAESENDAVNAIKLSLFGRRCIYPVGYGKPNPFSAEYTKAYNRLFFSSAKKDLDAAKAKLSQALKGNDLKACRSALASLDYYKDNFAQRVPAFKDAKRKFLDALMTWANEQASDPSNKYGVTKAKVQAAFPPVNV